MSKLSENMLNYSKILSRHGVDVENLMKIQTILEKHEMGLFKELPVAEGTEVYVIDCIYECKYDYDCPFSGFDRDKCEDDVSCEHQYKCYRIRKTKFHHMMLEAVGKTVFLTESAAETAIKKLEGGEHV